MRPQRDEFEFTILTDDEAGLERPILRVRLKVAIASPVAQEVLGHVAEDDNLR